MIARRLKALRRDQRGAAIVELALSAPILAAIVIGMSDLARGYSLKLDIEQAAQRTIEQVEQQKGVANSYNDALAAEAGAAMTAAGYSTGNTITPDSWVECSSNGTTWTRKTNFTDACGTGDTTARYAKINISRKFWPIFGRLWPNSNSDKSITVSGNAVVRVQ